MAQMNKQRKLKQVVKAWPDTQQPCPTRCWFLELECGHVVYRPINADPPMPPPRSLCDECDEVSEPSMILPVYTPELATDHLRKAGLKCEIVPGKTIHILGGLDEVNSSGIKGYQRSFLIYQEEEDYFLASVADSSPWWGDEAQARTLYEAVEFVVSVYKSRK